MTEKRKNAEKKLIRAALLVNTTAVIVLSVAAVVAASKYGIGSTLFTALYGAGLVSGVSAMAIMSWNKA